MIIPNRFLVAAPLLAGVLGGCAGVKPHDGFATVSQDVVSRTGYAVHWHDGSDADRQADAKVAELLAKPLTLDAAVQIALLNNRHLQATYEDLGIAQADLVQAGLLRNPVFDAAYRFGDGGAPAKIDLGITFDFVDLLFIGVRKDLAASELEMTKARVTGEVLDLANEVKTAYVAQQAADQTVALRKQVVDAAAASADFAKRLRDAGNTTALALVNEQASQAEADLQLSQAEANAAACRERLTMLIGVWGLQTGWTLAGPLPPPTAPEPAAVDIEKQAIANSLDLRIGRTEIASSLKRLGIAQPLGVLSELETGISAEREDGIWYTGPSVTLPIPIFSQGQPEVAKAVAKVRQAEANLYATSIDIRSTVRAAHARVLALRKQIDSMQQTLLPLRQSIVHETMLQYNAMQVGTFQLLAAKRDQIEASASFLSLLRDYWTAKAQLESILNGRMPRDSLSPLDAMRNTGTGINADEHG